MGQFSVEICHLVGQCSMKLNSRAKCDKQKRLHGGAVTENYNRNSAPQSPKLSGGRPL